MNVKARSAIRWIGSVGFLFVCLGRVSGAPDKSLDLQPEALAANVTIYRDAWGVPHIDGSTDASVVFAFAYAQAEDYFWQIEDNYLLALGRYAEFHGSIGLNSDLLNRAFEVVPRSKEGFGKLQEKSQETCKAFVAGLNYYLAKHPQVKPRAITKFEPWMLLALNRQLIIELCYRFTGLSNTFAPREHPLIYTSRGSNAWAIAPSRTKSKHPILMINPHQPWFGFGQFYEAHLRSGEGWDFSGASFFGLPLPLLGHNEYCGWAGTTNEPGCGDAWRETFDDPQNPLHYKYGKGYRVATEWKDVVAIRGSGSNVEQRSYTFRKTHHGPVLTKEDDTHYLSGNIAKMFESDLIAQGLQLMRAKNLGDFKSALRELNFQYTNLIYADREGNIFYIYNGIVPKRDLAFDWTKPVDGSDPRTEWKGYHPIEDLPQVLNPISGFVQNCNSSPFTTTDDGNPFMLDFPPYMARGDKTDDKRRAKMARMRLRAMKDATFDQAVELAYDNTLYWPMVELPVYQRDFELLKKRNPALAEQVAPYLEHLLDWDYKTAFNSTQSTLCLAWYEELYGFGYPHETLLPRYLENPDLRFQALINAADALKKMHGDWKVAWGSIHRIQRRENVSDFLLIPFQENLPSIPSLGAPSPLGVLFTQIYTPSVNIPFVKKQKQKFGVVGATYLAVIEFGEKVRPATLINFGQSGDPKSPHFFDQAKLLSERKLKPSLFYWEDVKAAARRVYQPGKEGDLARNSPPSN